MKKQFNKMDLEEYKTLADFKGHLSYKGGDNPDQYERIQFMKNFGDKKIK